MIQADTFDNTKPHDTAIFNKSLKNITNYYLQLNHSNDVSEAICNVKPTNFILPDIHQPKPDSNNPGELIPISNIDTYLWK
jgi:hypothetical protein